MHLLKESSDPRWPRTHLLCIWASTTKPHSEQTELIPKNDLTLAAPKDSKNLYMDICTVFVYYIGSARAPIWPFPSPEKQLFLGDGGSSPSKKESKKSLSVASYPQSEFTAKPKGRRHWVKKSTSTVVPLTAQTPEIQHHPKHDEPPFHHSPEILSISPRHLHQSSALQSVPAILAVPSCRSPTRRTQVSLRAHPHGTAAVAPRRWQRTAVEWLRRWRTEWRCLGQEGSRGTC